MIGKVTMETFLEIIIGILDHLDSGSLGLVNILKEKRVISLFLLLFLHIYP